MIDDAASTTETPLSEDGPGRGRRRGVRLVAFAAMCVAALVFVYVLSDIFAPVLAALALAYMLDPLVRGLEARGWTRKRAVIIIFAAATLVVVVLVAASVPFVVRDIMYAVDKIEAAVASEAEGAKPGDADSSGIIAALRRSEPLRRFLEWAEENKLAESAVTWLQENARVILERTLSVGKAGLAFTSWLGFTAFMIVLFPVYLYFFMVGLGGWRGAALSVVPPAYRPRTERIAGELGVSLSAFFRGRLVVGLAVGVVTAAGFAIMGLRFGIFLGLAIGIATIVPFLNVVFLVPALAIALVDFQSLWWMAAAFGVYMIGQALDPILTPYLMSRGTGLHAVTIIVSLFVWGRLLGFTGLLLAVPLTAAVKVLGRELVLPILVGHEEKREDEDEDEKAGDGNAAPGGGEPPTPGAADTNESPADDATPDSPKAGEQP